MNSLESSERSQTLAKVARPASVAFKNAIRELINLTQAGDTRPADEILRETKQIKKNTKTDAVFDSPEKEVLPPKSKTTTPIFDSLDKEPIAGQKSSSSALSSLISSDSDLSSDKPPAKKQKPETVFDLDGEDISARKPVVDTQSVEDRKEVDRLLKLNKDNEVKRRLQQR